MKRTNMLLIAVVGGSLLARMALGAEAEQEYVYTAEKKAQAAVVDGVAGSNEYPAAVMVMKQTPERETIQNDPAQARAFHDGKMLYIVMTVPGIDEAMLSKGEYWSQNDGVEVCFRDPSGAKPGPTFVLQGFVTGKMAGSTSGGASDAETEKLAKTVKFSAKVDKTSWTGEWAIPLEAAGITYKPGLKLDFNLGVWRSGTFEWIIWRGAQGATFQLENGGKLILK